MTLNSSQVRMLVLRRGSDGAGLVGCRDDLECDRKGLFNELRVPLDLAVLLEPRGCEFQLSGDVIRFFGCFGVGFVEEPARHRIAGRERLLQARRAVDDEQVRGSQAADDQAVEQGALARRSPPALHGSQAPQSARPCARVIYAASRQEIEARRKAFLRKWRLKCRPVADSLEEAGDKLFTFTRFPPCQWKSIRTSNAIERLHEEFKRRIKTQTVLPCAETAAMLFWALLASGQITMRKVDGWQTLSQSPTNQTFDLAA